MPGTCPADAPRRWLFLPVLAVIRGLALTACGAAAGAVTTTAGTVGGPGVTPAGAPSPSATITPAGTAPVEPSTPIVVLARAGTLTGVNVTNTISHRAVMGSFSADHRRWSSTDPLGYGAHGAAGAATPNPAGVTGSTTGVITTITPTAQAATNPAPAAPAHSGIGVGQPIVVRFTHPVTNKARVQQHLQVQSNPPQPGAWY